ncbi:DUF1877 family protein [Chryseobacterium turcicum]|uniref:DUF1877 domain-containing protein n=1 Tax=Chryseobacterium turcicum TaxID=2898076 RepID=A0A9Q3V106_9FLAO|nr:DUF1877 family protein [Chryseobacterium turcicum]MCD1116147.1 hypothetical protein [Chryseobacterium turcicum]
MGIIVSYSVVSDENIVKEVEENMNTKISIEDIINQYSNKIESFTTYVKTWDPLYFLLYQLSSNKHFLKLREYHRSPETNEYTKVFSKEEVYELFKELQNINLEALIISLDNEGFKKDISTEEGYNMELIFNIEGIFIEFNELKNAVNKAYTLKSKLIQILFP